MDGMDFTTIDEIDQGMFDVSPGDSGDEDEDLPLPDFIGIDSALQDEEKSKLESASRVQRKNRSTEERELELRLLAPDSIRREILERSIRPADKPSGSEEDTTSRELAGAQRASHLMNIMEKAGMSGIDKDRINSIIHEVSKGSLFYKKQAERQAKVHQSIMGMLERVEAASPAQLEEGRAHCDRILQELEKQRVFNKIIVHVDLDMFFAAVEIRDNPSLENKPVAVGGNSMLSTSNYIARRFGVRAAMPGFIARKLCPQLVIVRPDGAKYREASSQVFAILEQYDPDLASMSLDEAYLDLTEYVKDSLERDGIGTEENHDGTLPRIWWTRASKVVEEIRVSIYGKTRLTCSAGIACNCMLAKISTDKNKPDGQFMVQGYPHEISEFISETPIERVSGIGKVSIQFLNALEIKTCADILTKRQLLPIVFMDVNLRFYLRAAIGDGSVSARTDDQRKSKSVERTFSPVKDILILLEKLDSICEELCSKYLKPYKIKGRTVTVKVKRNTFTTTTRSYSLLVPTGDKLVIYSTAKKLFLAEIEDEPPEISYRLLGVKISNLADDGVTSNQPTIEAMLRNQEISRPARSDGSVFRAIENPRHETHGQGQRERSSPNTSGNTRQRSTSASSPRGARSLSSPSDRRIDSFFQRIPRTSPTEPSTSRSHSSSSDQGESVGAFDVPDVSSSLSVPMTPSNKEPIDTSGEEELPCPFCFKLFVPFSALEEHTRICPFKTTIDVNKSFIPSQRARTVSSPSTSTQAPAKRISKDPKEGIKKFFKASTSPPTSSSSSNRSSNEGTTFFQQFLESNSKSLDQARKTEAWRCMHCKHGFLQFPLLQAHVEICTKRKSK